MEGQINIGELVKKHLDKFNQCFTQRFQSAIETEMNKAILQLKEDWKSEIEALNNYKNSKQQEIAEMDLKIEILIKENEILTREIKELKRKLACAAQIMSEPESSDQGVMLETDQSLYCDLPDFI